MVSLAYISSTSGRPSTSSRIQVAPSIGSLVGVGSGPAVVAATGGCVGVGSGTAVGSAFSDGATG